MQHGLRMIPRRLAQLDQLWRAGAAGLPVLLTREAELFVANGLAEFFTDPRRVLDARLRITVAGERFAAALCTDKKERSMTDQKPYEDAAVRAQRRRGLCACRTGYANSPGIHNNHVRLYGRCSCACHGNR